MGKLLPSISHTWRIKYICYLLKLSEKILYIYANILSVTSIAYRKIKDNLCGDWAQTKTSRILLKPYMGGDHLFLHSLHYYTTILIASCQFHGIFKRLFLWTWRFFAELKWIFVLYICTADENNIPLIPNNISKMTGSRRVFRHSLATGKWECT